MMREREIEKKLVDAVKTQGGVCWKFISPGTAGVPDRIILIENPTEEDMTFWRDVFETHRLAVSPKKKPKTDKQILKWLKNPHSDTAEYKMWGNGIALPCAFFVLSGIAHFAK